MLCLCSVIFNISLSASNSFLEVCCAKKVGKRCFRYIEILTSRIHKYICIYIFRCLFYKPTVTTLVIFKDVTARCWQKSTACRHQILLVLINSPSNFFHRTACHSMVQVNRQLCLSAFSHLAFEFSAWVHTIALVEKLLC